MNIALYGSAPRRKRWGMTERGSRWVHRDRASLAIGPSSIRWDGSAVEVDVDEITVPWPSRIRGRLRLEPLDLVEEAFPLDARGLHRWRPWAARARLEVALERPALRWRGHAYLDSNEGDEPLEDAFSSWHWSRSALDADRAAVLYDVARRDGSGLSLALRFEPGGSVERFEPPSPVRLPSSLVWRIGRRTRADRPDTAVVTRTLEDTPFYARSVIAGELLGSAAAGVHESLHLDRFASRWVQLLLPFRMPRRP